MHSTNLIRLNFQFYAILQSLLTNKNNILPIVDHVADDEASLIGSITGCRLARETFN